ncbi:hypothetical protein WR25_02410 isoform B [Diploscapter pachys]|uniref:Uncharacterized protein n=1 Tax=Diploscapter pachys TaxID=2018661 RepID=A0A2A2JNB0_9BILA|nr:hypothetical protein WR25_02410 isoform A [Diploscapter pachys]PAV63296.1 hypothetical protein WR25_02410 isoform B [Diploscapter pachys]
MVFPINLPQLVPSSTARTARYVQQQNEAQLHRQPPDPLTPLVMAPPLVVQHIAQNLHTEMQFGLSPATTGGFFASGLLRTRSRPRAFSMLPLQHSISHEDLTALDRVPLLQTSTTSRKSRGGGFRQRYYPLSQEETLELLLLLNNQGVKPGRPKA